MIEKLSSKDATMPAGGMIDEEASVQTLQERIASIFDGLLRMQTEVSAVYEDLRMRTRPALFLAMVGSENSDAAATRVSIVSAEMTLMTTLEDLKLAVEGIGRYYSETL